MAEILSTNKEIKELAVRTLWPLAVGRSAKFENIYGDLVRTPSPVEKVLYFASSTKEGSKVVAFDTKNARYVLTIPSYGRYLG